jgi:hypothetical protein
MFGALMPDVRAQSKARRRPSPSCSIPFGRTESKSVGVQLWPPSLGNPIAFRVHRRYHLSEFYGR